MYLKNIIIRNSGPLEKIDIEMPFNEDGTPKPVIFVGENGSGKTILLSSIVDALHEIANKCFDDILQKNPGSGWKYYKLLGDINQKVGTKYGFNLLCFLNPNSQYIEKTGLLTLENCIAETGNILNKSINWNDDGVVKYISTKINDVDTTKDLRESVYCYFPANRYELPYWYNEVKETEKMNFNKLMVDRLQKPIEVTKSLTSNKSWLLDIILDVFISQNSNYIQVITDFLKMIIGKELTISIGGRNKVNRLTLQIGDHNIPNLDSLSLGQSVLINLFLTILRYNDNNDNNIDLKSIKGIVIIDEIDLHLHTFIQVNVLPKVVKMFPRIQFVLTTHSPLFLLGMKKEYGGEDGFEVYDLPKGERILVEDFSEFGKAYDSFKNSNTYKDELSKKISKSDKPIVFVEGPTDIDYIKLASRHLGKEELFSKINIDCIGEETPNGTKNSCNIAMKEAGRFLKYQQKIIISKVLLLFDVGEKCEEYTNERLIVRSIKQVENNPIRNGIENLFCDNIINKAIENTPNCFNINRNTNGDQPEVKTIKVIDGQKRTLFRWMESNTSKEDFENFKSIFTTIEEIIEPREITSSLAQ